MREIKFRAWDEVSKTMYPGIPLTLGKQLSTSQFARTLFVIGNSVEEYEDGGKVTLMQFTGLHDKNGKEVYEGDIFQCRSGDNKADMQGEVYFEEGCFRMKYGYQKPRADQRKDYFLSSVIESDGAAKIEVIGNIYENPELLK